MSCSGWSHRPKSIISEAHTCEHAVRRLTRVARAGCPEDADAVAALPDNWVPRHSTPLLANYLKQREQDHNSVLDEIAKGADAVNDDINKRVRVLAENLLAHIQQTQRSIDCIVDKCDANLMPLTVEDRDEALKSINDIMQERIDCTNDFKRDALNLETERADKLRILLRGHFQRLVAVGHKTPKDLIHEFDERIYNINQQLLSNSKAYAEMQADLRGLSTEGIMRARTSLNQLCLGVGMAVRGRSALIWCKDQKISRQRSQSAQSRGPSSNEPLLGNILDDVGEFDAIIARLVQAYRNAVLRVFSGFSCKLTELEKDLGHELRGPNEFSKIEILDLQRLLERPLQRLTEKIGKSSGNKTVLEITGADVISMQKSVQSLGESLRETCSILNHAGHLWDAHILRTALAQKLTIAAVEDLLTSHDSIELTNEVPFNIALEQLRCAADVEKVQQQFDSITVMLEKTAEMYLHHSEAELGRLEEFMNFPAVMANTLLAEFEVFLEKYPRAPIQVGAGSLTELLGSPGTPRRSPSNLSSVKLPLPRAIFQTELQEVALQNWRNGFLESFAANVSLVPEELKHQARLWVEERSAALHMRYSLKIVSHAIRLERVKAARELRIAELRYHDMRLESHLSAIYELVDRLPVEASQFAAIDAPMLYPLCDWIERMRVNIQEVITKDPVEPEVKKMKMKSYAPRLVKHRELFEESLNLAISEFKRMLEHRIQEARISNVRFISQIKLFSEGGQYAAQEATKTSTALGKGADALEACISKTLDVLNQRRNQLLALADHLILPLQRLVEETIKPPGKNAPKPPMKSISKMAAKAEKKKKK
ncbi:hypothetical protein B5X24_HaOG207998 [Helicoverpa armigera]|uniref:DUF4455 domain-containing protein n=1 Tax=Helicoverpa armigera TaxID=29058 RepID=A0A2W1BN62_HELAM|nr:hypothetical protein B5X24_HaOG207998 [Helicoverpa armigera]